MSSCPNSAWSAAGRSGHGWPISRWRRTAFFITSAAHSSGPIRWGGLELQPGDIVFHSRGERMHQRTSGTWHWESISQTPQHLAACIKDPIGTDLVAPQAGQVLRLLASILAPVRRLHADACRLVEKKPELIALPAVAHALEQDLIYALVTCLSGPDRQHSAPLSATGLTMRQFEDALAVHPERSPALQELCKTIGVPERTLRVCCTEFLGMAPTRYFRLRRLGMVRATLRRADPATANVSDIAARYGFRQSGKFAAKYRAVF